MEIAKGSYKKGQKNSQKGLIIEDGGSILKFWVEIWCTSLLAIIALDRLEGEWDPSVNQETPPNTIHI